MDVITRQFILPVEPQIAPHQPIIYPWENTNLYNLCMQLYELARNTGYTESFEEFKTHFGAYLESDSSIIHLDEYTGEYNITPLPNVEQILDTKNKIVRDNIVVGAIPYDLSQDDVTRAAVLNGVKFHLSTGEATTGIMPNCGAITGILSDITNGYTIPEGYHNGQGKVNIDLIDAALLIPGNIREGITILGITGTLSTSEGIQATSVNITPYLTTQTIVPSDLGEYNSISQVNVAAIAYEEIDNEQGGKTAIIGTVKP